MKEVNFFLKTHLSTKRDYLKYMNINKPDCMTVAKKYDKDFFDGERKFGYGGYKYIPNRWDHVIEQIINHYNLNSDSKILDAGAGKGYFLSDLKKKIKSKNMFGFDISEYAINNSPKNIKDKFFVHDIRNHLNFSDNYFDLVTCFGVIHNLAIFEIEKTIKELIRVSKNQYLWVESYRNNRELFNLQCWAKTCDSFFSPEEWYWLLKKFKYKGEIEFIFFD